MVCVCVRERERELEAGEVCVCVCEVLVCWHYSRAQHLIGPWPRVPDENMRGGVRHVSGGGGGQPEPPIYLPLLLGVVEATEPPRSGGGH